MKMVFLRRFCNLMVRRFRTLVETFNGWPAGAST